MKLEYRIDQARAEAAHGYTEKALTSLRHILAKHPNNVDALLALADITDDLGEILRCFRRVFAIDPDRVPLSERRLRNTHIQLLDLEHSYAWHQKIKAIIERTNLWGLEPNTLQLKRFTGRYSSASEAEAIADQLSSQAEELRELWLEISLDPKAYSAKDYDFTNHLLGNLPDKYHYASEAEHKLDIALGKHILSDACRDIADEMYDVRREIINKFKPQTPPKKNPRHISSKVKREVWRRDQGRCVECGSKESLEFDHIIPISKGGSNTARNVQILCEPCNRAKADQIQ